MGDRGEQVHLLLPAGLGALALLAVHGHPVPRRNVPRIPAYGGIEPRVQRVRPEPAVLPLLPEGFRGLRLRLPLLPLPLQLALAAPPGARRTRPGSRVQRRVRQRRGQAGLELIRIQLLPGPGTASAPTAPPAAPSPGEPGQPWAASSSWSQPSAASATASGPGTRTPAPAAQHRYHRGQLMADPPPLPPVRQPRHQRPPQRPRLRRPPRRPGGGGNQPRSAMMYPTGAVKAVLKWRIPTA